MGRSKRGKGKQVDPKPADDYKVGDLLMGKYKGYPPWPCKVMDPRDEKEEPQPRKVWVMFYATENYGWLTTDKVEPYTEAAKEKSLAPIKLKEQRNQKLRGREVELKQAFELLDEDRSTKGIEPGHNGSPLAVIQGSKGDECDALDDSKPAEAPVLEYPAQSQPQEEIDLRNLDGTSEGADEYEPVHEEEMKSTEPKDKKGSAAKRGHPKRRRPKIEVEETDGSEPEQLPVSKRQKAKEAQQKPPDNDSQAAQTIGGNKKKIVAKTPGDGKNDTAAETPGDGKEKTASETPGDGKGAGQGSANLKGQGAKIAGKLGQPGTLLSEQKLPPAKRRKLAKGEARVSLEGVKAGADKESLGLKEPQAVKKSPSVNPSVKKVPGLANKDKASSINGKDAGAFSKGAKVQSKGAEVKPAAEPATGQASKKGSSVTDAAHKLKQSYSAATEKKRNIQTLESSGRGPPSTPGGSKPAKGTSPAKSEKVESQAGAGKTRGESPSGKVDQSKKKQTTPPPPSKLKPQPASAAGIKALKDTEGTPSKTGKTQPIRSSPQTGEHTRVKSVASPSPAKEPTNSPMKTEMKLVSGAQASSPAKKRTPEPSPAKELTPKLSPRKSSPQACAPFSAGTSAPLPASASRRPTGPNAGLDGPPGFSPITHPGMFVPSGHPPSSWPEGRPSLTFSSVVPSLVEPIAEQPVSPGPENEEEVRAPSEAEIGFVLETFENMLDSLTRTRDSIGRTTKYVIDNARLSIAGKIMDIIISRLRSEVKSSRRVDIFFLVDSITQLSKQQTDPVAHLIPAAVEKALPKILPAVIPPEKAPQEDVKQVVKVLNIWKERRILAEGAVMHYLSEVSKYSGLEQQKKVRRSERTVDDPLRDYEEKFLEKFNEYGSNQNFMSGPSLTRLEDVDYDADEPPPGSPAKKPLPFRIGDLSDFAGLLRKSAHDEEDKPQQGRSSIVLEEVLDEVEMEMQDHHYSDHETKHMEEPPAAPPLPPSPPPSPPPLPPSPPPPPPPEESLYITSPGVGPIITPWAADSQSYQQGYPPGFQQTLAPPGFQHPPGFAPPGMQHIPSVPPGFQQAHVQNGLNKGTQEQAWQTQQGGLGPPPGFQSVLPPPPRPAPPRDPSRLPPGMGLGGPQQQHVGPRALTGEGLQSGYGEGGGLPGSQFLRQEEAPAGNGMLSAEEQQLLMQSQSVKRQEQHRSLPQHPGAPNRSVVVQPTVMFGPPGSSVPPPPGHQVQVNLRLHPPHGVSSGGLLGAPPGQSAGQRPLQPHLVPHYRG